MRKHRMSKILRNGNKHIAWVTRHKWLAVLAIGGLMLYKFIN